MKKALATILMAVFGLVTLTAALPHSDGITSRGLIVDEAGILETDQLVNKLNTLTPPPGFDGSIAVLATDDVSESDYDADIKAKAESRGGPEMIRSGKLKPGVILITISPEVRKVGIYSADDSIRSYVPDVVDAMRGSARDGDWNKVAVEGAKTYFDRVGDSQDSAEPSGDRTAGILVVVGIFSVVILCVFGVFIRKESAKKNALRGIDADTLDTLVTHWKNLDGAPRPVFELISDDAYAHRSGIEDAGHLYARGEQLRSIRQAGLTDLGLYADFAAACKPGRRSIASWKAMTGKMREDLGALRTSADEAADLGFDQDTVSRIRSELTEAPRLQDLTSDVKAGKKTAAGSAKELYSAMGRISSRISRLIERSGQTDLVIGNNDHRLHDETRNGWGVISLLIIYQANAQASAAAAAASYSSSTSSFSSGGFSGGSGSF